MRILITNDDGIHAAGIRALAEVASQFGEVAVVAPDRERSACGHSMTMHDPLRIREQNWHFCKAFEVNGLPVDCVNVGLTVAFQDGCDLVLSGINHGGNLGYDITYSGTVGGAMEAAINGIKAVALSMALFVHDAPLHIETGKQWLLDNWRWLIGIEQTPGTFLNVNIPAIAYPEIQGVQVVPMGRRVYEDRVEERADPWGRRYFWQGGIVVMDKSVPGTDFNAVANGFVAVTPISLDWTHHESLSSIKPPLK